MMKASLNENDSTIMIKESNAVLSETHNQEGDE